MVRVHRVPGRARSRKVIDRCILSRTASWNSSRFWFDARRPHFRIVGHLLEEMDADALHFDGDDLGVEKGALEEPTLVIDLIAREADVAAAGPW